MNSENEERIAQLNKQVEILEKQKVILFDALDVISSACTPETIKDLSAAKEALNNVGDLARSAMSKMILVK